MSIKSDLANFYTRHAVQYYQTRQKYWADGYHFLQIIKDLKFEKPKILELGCGGGRFLSFLKEHYKGDFDYCGVDLSQGLLDLAQKDHPEAKFYCKDMLTAVIQDSQEQYDIIVACASFQHLPDEKERIKLIQNCYRILNYEGVVMMTNRSLSKWFLKKHWKALLRSGLVSLLSLGRKSWRDVFIPWRSGTMNELRYYHIFGLQELKNLFLLGGFILGKFGFLDRRGEWTTDWKKANNSFFVAKKTIFIEK